MTTCTALELRSVDVKYHHAEEPALSQVSFQVNSGQKLALLGLNGSGKTTLLMAIAGLVPHEGELFVCGDLLNQKNLSRIREKIGFLFSVPEDQILFPVVLEDVTFGLVRRKVPKEEAEERAVSILEQLGIAHLAQRGLYHLSHGQKQRVAMAGAMITSPELLLFDEPSAGLDPPAKRKLGRFLSALDTTILVATHDIEFASLFCDRYLTIESGGVATDQSTPEVTLARWNCG